MRGEEEECVCGGGRCGGRGEGVWGKKQERRRSKRWRSEVKEGLRGERRHEGVCE